MEFDYIVGGIEDGIIALLEFLYERREDNADGYLNQIESYGGELDEKSIRNAAEALAGHFPLMLVAYGDGVDKEMPATSSVFGERRIFRHDCTFSVMAVTDNARSEVEQRRGAIGDAGVYKMIADIRSGLSGVRFAHRVVNDEVKIVVVVPNKKLPEGDVLLNLEPLRPAGVEYLARLSGLTAYNVHFDTYFNWTEPDRRAAGIAVEDLVLDLSPLGGPGYPVGKPGVISE